MNRPLIAILVSAFLCALWGCGASSSQRATNRPRQDENARQDAEEEEEEEEEASEEGPLPTAADQGNSEEDLAITQRIRRDLVSYDGLSFAAKQVVVITREGVVTLRGGVESAAERDIVARVARDTPGVLRVDDRLDTDD